MLTEQQFIDQVVRDEISALVETVECHYTSGCIGALQAIRYDVERRLNEELFAHAGKSNQPP